MRRTTSRERKRARRALQRRIREQAAQVPPLPPAPGRWALYGVVLVTAVALLAYAFQLDVFLRVNPGVVTGLAAEDYAAHRVGRSGVGFPYLRFLLVEPTEGPGSNRQVFTQFAAGVDGQFRVIAAKDPTRGAGRQVKPRAPGAGRRGGHALRSAPEPQRPGWVLCRVRYAGLFRQVVYSIEPVGGSQAAGVPR